MRIKLLIVGDSNTEKTALLLRYANSPFSRSYISTVGVDFKIKNIILDGKRLQIQIWDTAGQERFRTITNSYFRGTQGILLVFDIGNKHSFESLRSYVTQIQCYAPDVDMIVVGNHCWRDGNDPKPLRKVSYEEGAKFAAQYNIPFFEVDVRENRNVDDAFNNLISTINDRLLVDEIKISNGLDVNTEGYCIFHSDVKIKIAKYWGFKKQIVPCPRCLSQVRSSPQSQKQPRIKFVYDLLLIRRRRHGTIQYLRPISHLKASDNACFFLVDVCDRLLFSLIISYLC